jgi:hypothetical protein
MGEIIEQVAAPLPMRATSTALAVARSEQLMKMMELTLTKENGITQLEKLMELQQKWDAEQARKSFFESLSLFQSDLPAIAKTKEASFGRGAAAYKYASLDDITEAIRPFLAKHGLSYRFEQRQEGNAIWVTCILTHCDGHSEKCSMSSLADGSGSKNAIQSIASSVTYLRRYTLTGATGVACVDEDIDGYYPTEEQQQGRQQQQYRQPQPQAQQVQYYPHDKFEKNLPQWQQLIESGAKTAAAVIATVESRQPMTDEQKKTINAIQQK